LHGEADPVVPFSQATRLHAALAQAHVPNRLVPIHGGKHGDFDGAEVLRANRAVRDFLIKQGIVLETRKPKTRRQSGADDEVVISSVRGR